MKVHPIPAPSRTAHLAGTFATVAVPSAVSAFAVLAALSALAAATVLAGTAAAQDEGCTAESPCEIVVTVDEGGFDGEREWTATTGDWFVIVATNLDANETDHMIVLQPHGIILHVPALEETASEPFMFDQPGEYVLRDEPTQDQVVLTVTPFNADVVEDMESDPTQGTTTSPDADAPGPGLALAVMGLAGAAWASRRP